MAATDALLQELQQAMGYMLLSDLHVKRHFLNDEQRAAVLSIPAKKYPLQAWNKAASYITGVRCCCQTIEEAVALLLGSEK